MFRWKHLNGDDSSKAIIFATLGLWIEMTNIITTETQTVIYRLKNASIIFLSLNHTQ